MLTQLIIAILMAFGFVDSAEEYHSLQATEQEAYHEIIEDDMEGI